jgi:hypothetical protein
MKSNSKIKKEIAMLRRQLNETKVKFPAVHAHLLKMIASLEEQKEEPAVSSNSVMANLLAARKSLIQAQAVLANANLTIANNNFRLMQLIKPQKESKCNTCPFKLHCPLNGCSDGMKSLYCESFSGIQKEHVSGQTIIPLSESALDQLTLVCNN